MDYPITEQKCGRIRTLFDKEIIKLGCVDNLLPLGDIARAVLTHVSHHS